MPSSRGMHQPNYRFPGRQTTSSNAFHANATRPCNVLACAGSPVCCHAPRDAMCSPARTAYQDVGPKSGVGWHGRCVRGHVKRRRSPESTRPDNGPGSKSKSTCSLSAMQPKRTHIRRRNGSTYNNLLGSGSGTGNRPIPPVESGPCCQDSPAALSP
jgi:hypothetical protein